MNIFDSSPVVYIDRHKIVVGVVKGGAVTTEVILDKAWDEVSLFEAAQSIRERFGKKIFLLIGDDLSYVLHETFPDKKKVTIDQVEALIRHQIPEDIEQLHWGYQFLDGEKGGVAVQVTAFVNQFVKQLQSALERSGLQVQYVEALSTSLATQLVNSAEPRLLFYEGLERLALVVHRQVILVSETLENFSESKIKSFLKYVTKEKNIKPQGIMVVGSIKLPGNAQVEQVELDPFVGILHSHQAKNRQKNIDFSVTKENKQGKNAEKKSDQETAVDSEEVPPNNNHRRTFILLGILLLLATITGALLYAKGYFKSNSTAADNMPQESAAPTQENELVSTDSAATASPTPIPLAEYSLQILNGSGRAGEAGIVEELLAAEGFTEIETGNADNYDYAQTIVQLKEGVPLVVYEEVVRALNSDYVLEFQEERLTVNSEHDVLIVLGSLQPNIE